MRDEPSPPTICHLCGFRPQDPGEPTCPEDGAHLVSAADEDFAGLLGDAAFRTWLEAHGLAPVEPPRAKEAGPGRRKQKARDRKKARRKARRRAKPSREPSEIDL